MKPESQAKNVNGSLSGKQYENQVGRNLFDIDEAKLSIYSVLPKIQFGLTERNIIL